MTDKSEVLGNQVWNLLLIFGVISSILIIIPVLIL